MCGAKISRLINEVFAESMTYLLRKTEDCLIQTSRVTVPMNVRFVA